VADRFKDICKSIDAAIPARERRKTRTVLIPAILAKFLKYLQEDVTNGHNVGLHHDKLLVVGLKVEKMGIVPRKDKRKRVFCSKAMDYSFEIDVTGRLKRLYRFKFTPEKKFLALLWEKLDNTDIAYDLIKKAEKARETKKLISSKKEIWKAERERMISERKEAWTEKTGIRGIWKKKKIFN